MILHPKDQPGEHPQQESWAHSFKIEQRAKVPSLTKRGRPYQDCPDHWF